MIDEERMCRALCISECMSTIVNSAKSTMQESIPAIYRSEFFTQYLDRPQGSIQFDDHSMDSFFAESGIVKTTSSTNSYTETVLYLLEYYRESISLNGTEFAKHITKLELVDYVIDFGRTYFSVDVFVDDMLNILNDKSA